MHEEQRQRTRDLLKERGIDRALFANFFTIKWLTGVAIPVQTGPTWFAGGPPVVWYEDGHFTLFIVDVYGGLTADLEREANCSVVTYLGYTIEQAIAGAIHLESALRGSLSQSTNGVVGIEQADVTAMMLNVMQDAAGDNTQFTPIDGWLESLRMVKTAEEIAKLRENFALSDVGHAAVRGAVAVGLREIDLWTIMHSAVERKAGQPVPFGNDCVVGHREANIGGPPLDHEIRAGDNVIIDVSTVLHGYWSDSCATYYATEPTQKQIDMHRTAMQALELGISLVKPGAVAKEIDQKLRQFIADAGYPVYPHHTGHGVGVSGHEGPRIVPYNDEVLEPGMVILLEPGSYYPGETGVRVEDAMLVTADGAEVLTFHDKSLPG
jgi:Xaa-Pro aminopeptidase